MGKIRGVSPLGGSSGAFKSGKHEKAKGIKAEDHIKQRAPAKPIPLRLSDKAKTGSRQDHRLPAKREMKEQAKRLMDKIKKRRQPIAPKAAIRHPPNKKKMHQKVTSGQFQDRHEGFVPHKTRWIESVNEPYDASKIIYSDDQYLAGTSPDQPFDPENIKGDARIFWEMVFAEETEVIVDLTSAEEGEQSYYPGRGEYYYFGDYRLVFLSEKKHTGYKKILLQYEHSGRPPRRLTLFHYYAWPEHGVLRGRSRRSFQEFVKRTIEITDKPLAVICRSGKGKAGTYIVMQQLLSRIEQKMITQATLSDALERLINIGREASDVSFVETESQFIMLVEAGYGMLELFSLKQRSRQDRDDMNFLDDYI